MLFVRLLSSAQGGVTTRSTPRRASCRANRAASSHGIYVARRKPGTSRPGKLQVRETTPTAYIYICARASVRDELLPETELSRAPQLQRGMGTIVGRIKRHYISRKERMESQQAGGGGEDGTGVMRQMSYYIPRKRGEEVHPPPPRSCCCPSVHKITTTTCLRRRGNARMVRNHAE